MAQLIPQGEYIDSGQDGAMVPFDAYSAGEMALRLADLKSRMGVVQQFFHEIMVEGQDYGVIPGTEKPALLKPGAEKLAELYGYSPIVKSIDETTGDGGFYEAKVTMALVSRKTGQTVAEGIGSANTFEGRYRWRWVWADKVPAGVDKSVLTSRTVGRNNTTQYRMENEDMYALWNTVLKMGKKRALVDVVLSATRSSGLFSQDAEAFEKWKEEGADDTPAEPRPANQAPPKRGSTARAEAAPRDDPNEPPISRFWKDVRALSITREQVIEHLGHERFEEMDSDALGELLIQLRDKHGKGQQPEKAQPALV